MALVLILIGGGWIRLGGIAQTGIRYDDEGAYALDARLWHRCMRVLTDGAAISAVLAADKHALQTRMDEIGIDFGDRYHPYAGYTFPAAAAMFLVGEGPQGLLLTNALLGTLSIWLVYMLCAALVNRSAALAAAAMFALSPYHIVYARSGMTDGTSVFFILLALMFWAHGMRAGWTDRRRYLLCGLALGYSLTVHYRCAYVPFVILGIDLWMTVRRGPWKAVLFNALVALRNRRAAWLWMLGGMIVPALCFEAVFRGARIAAWIADAHFPVRTFFEQYALLAKQTAEIGTAAGGGSFWNINRAAPGIYAGFVLMWQGWVFAALALSGLVIAARARGRVFLPILMIALPLAALSMQPYPVARGFSAVVPLLCIAAALAVERGSAFALAHRVRASYIVPVTIAIFVCLTMLPEARRISSWRSDIPNVVRFLEERDASLVAVPVDRRKYDAYFNRGSTVKLIGGRHYRLTGDPRDVLTSLRERGVTHIVTDPQIWHYRGGHEAAQRVYDWWRETYEVLERECELVAEFPHLLGRTLEPDRDDLRREFLAEGPGLGFLREIRAQGDGAIRIYGLTEGTGSLALRSR